MKPNSEGINSVFIKDPLDELVDPASEGTLADILTQITLLASGSGQYTTMVSGRKTISVTGTAVALAASTTCKRIIITALVGNSAQLYVGDSSVEDTSGSETGTALLPLNSMDIPIDNLSKVYINGTSGDGVSYTYYT